MSVSVTLSVFYRNLGFRSGQMGRLLGTRLFGGFPHDDKAVSQD